MQRKINDSESDKEFNNLDKRYEDAFQIKRLKRLSNYNNFNNNEDKRQNDDLYNRFKIQEK